MVRAEGGIEQILSLAFLKGFGRLAGRTELWSQLGQDGSSHAYWTHLICTKKTDLSFHPNTADQPMFSSFQMLEK